MNEVIRDRAVVCNVGYHLVWSVKYKRKVLVGKIESSLLEFLRGIAEEIGECLI